MPATVLETKVSPPGFALPSWLAAGATVLSAVAYAAAFPPDRAPLLGWVALVPFFSALESRPARARVLLAILWSCVMTAMVGACLPNAIEAYYEQPPWVGWAFLAAAGLSTAVPQYVLFAVAYGPLTRRPVWSSPLLVAAAWTAAEYLRVALPPGNPWALIGYSQAPLLPVVQIADVAGVFGIGFCVAAVNAALTFPLFARGRGSEARIASLRGAVATAILLASVLAYGVVALRRVEPVGSPSVVVAVVQPNLPVGGGWLDEREDARLRSLVRLTHEALEARSADVVYWPESAMRFRLADEPTFRAYLAHEIGSRGAELVAGGPRRVEAPGRDEPDRNSVFSLTREGRIAGYYDKERLLPFAEYYPLGSRAWVRRDPDAVPVFSPGVPRPPLPSAAGPTGVLVCNEVFFGDAARDRVARGAEVLLNPANDSWFGDRQYSEMAADMSRLRAVEQRRPLVRVSTAGPSSVVGPAGRLLAETEPFERAWIGAEVGRRTSASPYLHLGDAFAQTCLLVTLLALALSRRGAPTQRARG